MSDPLASFKAKFGKGSGVPGGGGPSGGSGDPTQQIMKEKQSFLNPSDMGAMAADGAVTADMSIRQFLESQGMDVEGPVTQLVEWQMKQMENADPLNKMKAIAGQGGANMQPSGQPPAPAGRMPQGKKPAMGAGLSGLQGAMMGGR
ncbi:MAG: hypothetical protein WC455_13580 [Dehalococcoidia bacterium]|jgi:hypothetical protein